MAHWQDAPGSGTQRVVSVLPRSLAGSTGLVLSGTLLSAAEEDRRIGHFNYTIMQICKNVFAYIKLT